MAASSASATRSIDTLELAPSTKAALTRAGYFTVADLSGVRPMHLAERSGLSPEEAVKVIEQLFGEGPAAVKCVSALEILQEERRHTPIVTFCPELDRALGGGVPLGKLVEFCGVPGIGKTQLAIQLSCDVQIPECLGGVGGEALFIDTEGSFLIERVVEMATALVEHIHQLAVSCDSEVDRAACEAISLESMMRGIHYYRVHTYLEQLALVTLLPGLLDGPCSRVKLVVIDSVSFAFRHDFAENMSQRTRILNGLAQRLHRLAGERAVCVVLTNQVTTRGIGTSTVFLAPALGESWGHNATIRANLFWDDGVRIAHVHKSPTSQGALVPFAVTAAGVRRFQAAPAKRRRDDGDDDDDDDDDGGDDECDDVGRADGGGLSRKRSRLA